MELEINGEKAKLTIFESKDHIVIKIKNKYLNKNIMIKEDDIKIYNNEEGEQ